jgi:hypothetical protein
MPSGSQSTTSSANHNAEIVSICIIFPLLSLLATIARFESKRMRHAYITVEDYLLVAAWVYTSTLA